MSYVNPLSTANQPLYQLPGQSSTQSSTQSIMNQVGSLLHNDGISLGTQPTGPATTIPIPTATTPPTTATPSTLVLPAATSSTPAAVSTPAAPATPAASQPATSSSGAIEVGIFQDDNGINTGHSTSNDGSNRQSINQSNLTDVASVTGSNPNVHVTTYATNTEAGSGTNKAVSGTIENGKQTTTQTTAGADPSVQSLANFVTTTLTNAQKNNAQPYLELAGHGNENGLLYSANGSLMTPSQISQAITQGEQAYAQSNPSDANRKIQGVILNSCDGDSQEFIDALSKTDIKTLIGGPNAVNDLSPSMFPLLTNPQGNAQAIAQAASASTGPSSPQTPDVAVQNLANGQGTALSQAMQGLDSAIESAVASNPAQKQIIANDANKIPQDSTENSGPPSTSLNKPSVPLYQALLADQSVTQSVRTAAQQALNAVNASTLAEVNIPSTAPDGLTDVASDHGTNAYFPSATTHQEDPSSPLVQALYG